VSAHDRAGNNASRTVHFTVLPAYAYVFQKKVVERESRVLVRLPGGCTESTDAGRLRRFIEWALPTASLRFTYSNRDFLAGLRSGAYNLYLLSDWSLPDDGASCGGLGGGSSGLPLPGLESGLVRQRMNDELSEAVFRGAGLVVLRSTHIASTERDEVLGVHLAGEVGCGTVSIDSSALSTGMTLAIPGGSAFSVNGARTVGRYSAGTKAALTAYTFGSGESVAMGFDPSLAAWPSDAATLLAGVVAHATPEARALPLGVMAVALDVTNTGVTAPEMQVTESVDQALVVVAAEDGGQILANGVVQWQPSPQAGSTSRLRYLVRFPEEGGYYATGTQVAVVRPDRLEVIGTYPLDLYLPEGEAAISSTAWKLAFMLSSQVCSSASRGAILDALSRVNSNGSSPIKDQERAISDLLAAVAEIRGCDKVGTFELRTEIDRMLGYWEAIQ
jgi:hypothetical protein